MHQETFELNCSRTSLAMDGTLVVVVEMSLSTWLVCAEVPGLERRAMMKMSVDEAELLSQLHRWRDEAEKRADCRVSRICVAYEAGRDSDLTDHKGIPFWTTDCQQNQKQDLQYDGLRAYAERAGLQIVADYLWNVMQQ